MITIPATAVMARFVVLAVGIGSTLPGERFRYYSYGAIVALLVLGALTGSRAG